MVSPKLLRYMLHCSPVGGLPSDHVTKFGFLADCSASPLVSDGERLVG